MFSSVDPVWREPDVHDASHVQPQDVDHVFSLWQAIHGVGDRTRRRAVDVNSIDEVPDSSWFSDRVGRGHLSDEDIARGPDRLRGPLTGPWVVLAGKTDGVTPGLQLRDARGRHFFVKFDPKSNPEMASGAEVIATKLFFALGYNVPENYIGILKAEDLTIAPTATFKGPDGRKRQMTFDDVDRVLAQAARNSDGTYRILASLGLDGTAVGPFEYYGTRADDPNDLIPHEHRRELRALRVFAAWLNHIDTKPGNSLDTLVQTETGQQIVRHNLLDFGSTLGSAGTEPKDWRDGHEYALEPRHSLLSLVTFGAYMPHWMFIRYPKIPAVGRIDGESFEPEKWKPTVPNPAFDNALPDDMFWAARRVMAFDQSAIRAVVAEARFTDPAATMYLGDVLIRRQFEIGRSWLTHVNPVVDPSVDRAGTLSFHNAAVETLVAMPPRSYEVRWSVFDNDMGTSRAVTPWIATHETECQMPDSIRTAEFFMVEIRANHPQFDSWHVPVRAYFHRASEGGRWTLTGLDRLSTSH
jgi:hypothetical protein